MSSTLLARLPWERRTPFLGFPRGSRGINKGCRIVRGKRRKERRLFTSLCNNLLPCFNERCEVVEAFILDEKLAVIGKEKVFLVFKDSFLNFFGVGC